MRSTIKRAVMGIYCAGWMPAWCVRVLFKTFRLRAA